MSDKLEFTLPGWPPSLNSMYITLWEQRKRVLSPEARSFKQKAVSHLTTEFFQQISEFEGDENCIYTFHASFYGNWFTRPGAKSKYKKRDVFNMGKLLEDVVAEILGIDDSANFRIVLDKVDSPEQLTIIRYSILRRLDDVQGSGGVTD